MFRRPSVLLLLLGLLLTPAALRAAAFTPGDLVIYRVGNGMGALVNTGNAVFLDEYTTAGVFVQSIALPTADSGSTHALIASGTGTSEGMLNLSPNGLYLTLTGYDSTTTAQTSTIKGTLVPRTIGLVTANGAVDTSTALTDLAIASGSGDSVRSALTLDGTHFYATGGTGGLRYATLGATTSLRIDDGTANNLRDVAVFSGQLYVSNDKSTFRLGTVGTGEPTTSPQTITGFPGLPVSGKASFDQFFLATLNPADTSPDTLYVADDEGDPTTGSTVGKILKYSLLSGTWTAEGSISASLNDAFHGLTGTVTGNTVTLYATSVGGGAAAGGGELFSITDNNALTSTLSGTATQLAAANSVNLAINPLGQDETFRGLAFVPTPEPSALASLLAGAAALGGLRPRRRSRP